MAEEEVEMETTELEVTEEEAEPAAPEEPQEVTEEEPQEKPKEEFKYSEPEEPFWDQMCRKFGGKYGRRILTSLAFFVIAVKIVKECHHLPIPFRDYRPFQRWEKCFC